MARHNVPAASIAVVRDGALLWAHTWGVSDLETGAPASETTRFQAASISKPVAALIAIQLAEEGLLALDQPLNAQLTDWQIPPHAWSASNPVTLRQVLAHAGGLSVHGFPGYASSEALPDLRDIVNGTGNANTAAVQVVQQPGHQWRYSGGGYSVAQLAIENATEATLAELADSRVFGPAGMDRSTFRLSGAMADPTDYARAHATSQSVPVEGHSHRYPESAAAGLWTTPTDLARLALVIIQSNQELEGAPWSAFTVSPMLSPHPMGGEAETSNQALGPGLSQEDDGLVFGHGGSNHGFRAHWFAYADGRGGAAIMTNADNGQLLIDEILSALANTYGWDFGATRRINAQLVPMSWAGLYSDTATSGLAVRFEVADEGARLTILYEGEAIFNDIRAFHSGSDTLTLENGWQVPATYSDGSLESLRLWGVELVRVNGPHD